MRTEPYQTEPYQTGILNILYENHCVFTYAGHPLKFRLFEKKKKEYNFGKRLYKLAYDYRKTNVAIQEKYVLHYPGTFPPGYTENSPLVELRLDTYVQLYALAPDGQRLHRFYLMLTQDFIDFVENANRPNPKTKPEGVEKKTETPVSKLTPVRRAYEEVTTRLQENFNLHINRSKAVPFKTAVSIATDIERALHMLQSEFHPNGRLQPKEIVVELKPKQTGWFAPQGIAYLDKQYTKESGIDSMHITIFVNNQTIFYMTTFIHEYAHHLWYYARAMLPPYTLERYLRNYIEDKHFENHQLSLKNRDKLYGDSDIYSFPPHHSFISYIFNVEEILARNEETYFHDKYIAAHLPPLVAERYQSIRASFPEPSKDTREQLHRFLQDTLAGKLQMV